MAEQKDLPAGSQIVTEPIFKEKTVTVTLQTPVKSLKLVLKYLNVNEYVQWLKTEGSSIVKTLKSGKGVSEAQVELLNEQMAASLDNLIKNFKEQVCQPLQVDSNDLKEIKLFKVRANKHVISVLEDISSWLKATLEKVSAPDQPIDEKVKEYDGIIKELKKKIKLLQTDKLSVEVQGSEDDKHEASPTESEDFKGSNKPGEKSKQRKTKDVGTNRNDSKDKGELDGEFFKDLTN